MSSLNFQNNVSNNKEDNRYKNHKDISSTEETNIKFYNPILSLRQNNNNISTIHINIIKNRENVVKIGDRFIPFKNTDNNNLQNFILNNNDNNYSYSNSHKSNKELYLSDEKPVKNYVSFIIDNMLKNSSDDYIIRSKINPLDKIKRRNNNIFSFSKNIYNSTGKINKITENQNLNHSSTNVKPLKYINEDIGFIEEIYNESNNIIFEKVNEIIEKNNKKQIIPNTNFLLNHYNKNKIYRKIPKIPEKILDAPNLIDDFYLNILDWGSTNILSVALANEVYLWNGYTYKTTLLMSSQENIISLSWMENGKCLAIGLQNGNIQLWDTIKNSKIREIKAHENRVTCLSWNNYILSSGSKDKIIKNFDVRKKNAEISKIIKHKQEICSLKYSKEGDLLSSGGNDNFVYIWDIRKINSENNKPYSINNLHKSAIKAMAWCPWKRHLLATGGGVNDKSIKFFLCDIGKLNKCVNTGSQVCALLFNNKEQEVISAHGFNKNQITIWNFKNMKKICELNGHKNRVLYLTMSPDEKYICSGSGDETLRFWRINNDSNKNNKNQFHENDQMMSNVLIH